MDITYNLYLPLFWFVWWLIELIIKYPTHIPHFLEW